jgi:hypothetical protein
MRWVSACLAVVAMLCALVSAPLFHLHEDDDHGHPGPFVHAHFPEPEQESPQQGFAVERSHSREHVRWLNDVFTVNPPVNGGFRAVPEIVEFFWVPILAETRVFLSVRTLHTHSSPDRSRLVPRSPPAN